MAIKLFLIGSLPAVKDRNVVLNLESSLLDLRSAGAGVYGAFRRLLSG